MTIDEAIKHLEHGTEQLEMEIKSGLWIKGSESELRCKEGIALNKQHIEWLKELKEAKRLLKLALDDIQTLNDLTVDDENGCLLEDKFESCTECPLYCGSDKYCGWRYQVDALMLIGGEPNK